MAILILFFIFSLTASPALAQLNPDETGCETWDNTTIDNPDNGWIFREGDETLFNQDNGMGTPGPQEGVEALWLERDFERKYVVSRVDLLLGFDEEAVEGDLLEVRLPSTHAVKRWEVISSYRPDPYDYFTLSWEGSVVADSVGIYLQAPTDTFERGLIWGVTICVNETVDLRNTAFVIRDLLFNPIVFVVGIVMSFALLMMLLNLLYEQFSR